MMQSMQSLSFKSSFVREGYLQTTFIVSSVQIMISLKILGVNSGYHSTAKEVDSLLLVIIKRLPYTTRSSNNE